MTRNGSEESTTGGWRGRVAAAIVGGSLLSFALGLCVTIYVPGQDGLDEAFMGGLALVVVWPIAMLWILFAHSAWGAWKRALIPLALLIALDVAGLML